MKACRKCGGSAPCKPCKAAYKQAWAEAHRDRVNKQKAAYEARHPERARAAKAGWYSRNKAEALAKGKQRKEQNREAIRIRYRQQYAEDPTPFIVRNKRRDEREKQVGGEFTAADKSALFQLQRGLCANPYCEIDLGETGFHIDHKTPVVLGGSHDPSNRQLLCPRCNHRKGILPNDEWLKRQASERNRCA